MSRRTAPTASAIPKSVTTASPSCSSTFSGLIAVDHVVGCRYLYDLLVVVDDPVERYANLLVYNCGLVNRSQWAVRGFKTSTASRRFFMLLHS